MTYLGLGITFMLAMLAVEGIRTLLLWGIYKWKQAQTEKHLNDLRQQLEDFKQSMAGNSDEDSEDSFARFTKTTKTH